MTDVTTVLVVDDHFLFAQAIGAAISATAGLELLGLAVTAPQALAMVRSAQPDVVLLDHHLPGTTADQLIPQLHLHAPATRVIVLTSDLAEATKVSAIRAGAAGFLTKDRAVEEVVDAVLGGAATVPGDDAGRAVPEPGPTGRPVREPGPARAQVPEPGPAGTQVREPGLAAPRIEIAAAGEDHLVVHAEGVASLEDVSRLERMVGAVASVERVHATRLSDGSASLIATLHAGRSSADVARDLAPVLASAWPQPTDPTDPTDSTDPMEPADPADVRAAMADALAGTAPRAPVADARHHERVAVSRRPTIEPSRPAVGVVTSVRPAVGVVTSVQPPAGRPWTAILLTLVLALALAGTAALDLGGPLLYGLAVLLGLVAMWVVAGSAIGLQLLLLATLVVFVERAGSLLLQGITDTEHLAAAGTTALIALVAAALAASALRRTRA